MTTNRNQLAPTSVVDKNGRIMIVYKKLAPVTTSSMPPVSIKKSQPTTYQFTQLIDEHSEMLNNYSPDMVPLLKTLLTTGSETTRHSTFRMITRYIHGEERLETVPQLAMYALAEWHAHNLLEESGLTLQTPSFLQLAILSQLPSLVTIMGVEGTIMDAIPYWRGRAILALIDSRVEGHHDFDAWADQRTDVEQIVALANDKQTTNPRTLQAFLEQQSTTSTALYNGLL